MFVLFSFLLKLIISELRAEMQAIRSEAYIQRSAYRMAFVRTPNALQDRSPIARKRARLYTAQCRGHREG